MAKVPFPSVDAYLAAQPQGAVLAQVRVAILAAVPDAEEAIAYNMPAYRLGPKRTVFYFAGWKKHWSLYPATEGMLAAFDDELAAYEVEKGTIRFPYAEPPTDLIARLARFRAGEAR